jgi:hypothetical protein
MLEESILQKQNGRHKVVISWDYSKGGLLAIDGVVKEDMDNDIETFIGP